MSMQRDCSTSCRSPGARRRTAARRCAGACGASTWSSERTPCRIQGARRRMIDSGGLQICILSVSGGNGTVFERGLTPTHRRLTRCRF
jgi:hypothetical protein